MATNPCRTATTYKAAGIANEYDITITIAEDAWNSCAEQDMVINILATTPIPILASLASRGNGIKRESDGWTIHTQSNKSLYDTNISKGDAAKKTFNFTKYKKRPH